MHGRASVGPSMPNEVEARDEGEAPVTDDPIVPVFREHTELQLLAARFQQMASELEHGEAVTVAQLLEAVEVHQRFLLQVHHAREREFAAAVRPVAPPAVVRALERCATVHPEASRFETEARSLLAAGPLTRERRQALAQALQREAERIVDHHREEDETIYRPLHHHLPPPVLDRLLASMHALAGEAAAAQARLVAWSSRVNASSD